MPVTSSHLCKLAQLLSLGMLINSLLLILCILTHSPSHTPCIGSAVMWWVVGWYPRGTLHYECLDHCHWGGRTFHLRWGTGTLCESMVYIHYTYTVNIHVHVRTCTFEYFMTSSTNNCTHYLFSPSPFPFSATILHIIPPKWGCEKWNSRGSEGPHCACLQRKADL